MRLVFMGTPDFAVSVLQHLHDSEHDIAVVYTQPARPSGRGWRVAPSPVEVCARRLGLMVETPANWTSSETQQHFSQYCKDGEGAEIAIIAAYGLLLPRAILEIPRFGCVNVHASLLPRWRGANPIAAAIAHGDTQTGISIMQMTEALDSGPVWTQEALPLQGDENAGIVHEKLTRMAGRVLEDALERIAKGKGSPADQKESLACYAPKRRDLRIDWARPAQNIEREIRAFAPSPGVRTLLDGTSLKIFRARVEPRPILVPEGTALRAPPPRECAGFSIIDCLRRRFGCSAH